MNEERFRELMRLAVGDEGVPPWLNHAVRARIERPAQPQSRIQLLALVAALLVFAVLVIAVGPRILNGSRSITPGGAATSGRFATPSPVEALSCSLPVIIYDQIPGPDPSQPWAGGSELAKLWGLVNTRTGQFTSDLSASRARQLPGDHAAPQKQALSYSPEARRWLPVNPERISPDGMSYAYLGDAKARKLMRYDIATAQTTMLWDAGFQLWIIRWTARGILVGDSEPDPSRTWLVDPETGNPGQTVALPSSEADSPPGGAMFNTLGTTATGEVIKEAALLNGSTVTIWVYYDPAGGKRVLIYSGTGPTESVSNVNGVMWHKGSGFDPGAAVAEGAEIWFSTFAPSFTVWHWDKARGLGQVDVALADPNILATMPAGACV